MDKEGLYSKFVDTVYDFMKENGLGRSEETADLLGSVIEDLRETWYRQGLGKNR